MADNSLTIDRNRFLALVLKSPTQMGWLSIINSVTNISRLGTFKVTVSSGIFFGLSPQLGLEPAAHTSEALVERYLNGSQLILGN
jgi:hypothetical protein